MAKISDRESEFHDNHYKRNVSVDRNGIFCITLPKIDGMPKSVSADTVKGVLDCLRVRSWETSLLGLAMPDMKLIHMEK